MAERMGLVRYASVARWSPRLAFMPPGQSEGRISRWSGECNSLDWLVPGNRPTPLARSCGAFLAFWALASKHGKGGR